MDITISSFIVNLITVFKISVWILCIYAIVLLIKALKIYINKNSKQ